MTDSSGSRAQIAGARALVVEDEIMVAMLIEQMLYDLGVASVRTASTVAEGLAAVEESALDFAALDVNLRGEQVFPIAKALAARNVPFLFVTGYGARGLEPGWTGRPVLQKPFSVDALEECVTRALT